MASEPVAVEKSELVAALCAVVNNEKVLHQPEKLLVYECDTYTLEKHPPDAVVLPRSTEQVSRIVKVCAARNVPIIPRGAGTSLSGSLLAVTGGVVISLTQMNHMLSINFRNQRALVEASYINA